METKIQPIWRKKFKQVCSHYIAKCSDSSALRGILERWRDLSDKESDPTKLLAQLKKDGYCNIDFCEAYAKEPRIKLDVQIVLEELFSPLVPSITKLPIPREPETETSKRKPKSYLEEHDQKAINYYILCLSKKISRLRKQKQTKVRINKIEVLKKIKNYLMGYFKGNQFGCPISRKLYSLLQRRPNDLDSYKKILKTHTFLPKVHSFFGKQRKEPESWVLVDSILKWFKPPDKHH